MKVLLLVKHDGYVISLTTFSFYKHVEISNRIQPT